MRQARPYYFFAILVLPMVIYLRNPQAVESLHNASASLMKPVFSAGSRVSTSILDGREEFGIFWKTLQQNRSDRDKISKMESALSSLQETKRENERLLKLLALKQSMPSKTIAARVIGWDPSLIRKSILLDKGKNQKVSKDMPVTVAEGLVGRVIEVSGSSAKVLLLTDADMRVGAITGTSRSQGIVAGDGSAELRMDYLELDSSVSVGEDVLTSGDSRLFPKGIRIGKITSLEKTSDGLHLSATVHPEVQFSKLEEVLCLESSPLK